MACELSNSDDLQHPENLKPRRDWNYRGTKNLCAKKPCLNNGKCYMGYTEKKYVCVCPAGYHGENCEKDINECESGPCLNNGTCTDRINAFNCSCPPGFSGNRCEIVYKNCAEVYKSGAKISGVNKIYLGGLGEFEVFCDQKTAGGGWTVFQKRRDGSVDFFRAWDDYKRGFGNLSGEFWLGLDKIHRLTVSGGYKLRVDLEDIHGKTAFAEYSSFSVTNETAKYQLNLGNYSGTAGDSLGYHRGMSFSTKDRDNDKYGVVNCALGNKGAWWYNFCLQSDLNGGRISWKHLKNRLKRSEMKIRQKDF
ncbi:ficolin-1-like [Porites lutea]|uniref:ficolin-1-like n=1 Tax=Porites lutea TaxID=51062 RepID=UPI003CC65FA8